MSRNEDIDNAIWSDPDFDALTADAALLYIWSFTNPRCGMAGIYRVSQRQLLEGKLEADRLAPALDELAQRRFAFYEDGVLWVRTRARYLRTKGEPMKRSILKDLEKIPASNPLLRKYLSEYGDSWFGDVVRGFGGGSEGVQTNGSSKPDSGTPSEPPEGFQGKGYGKGKGVSKEFEDWLEHYRETTGRPARGSSTARSSYAARRREGFTLDELKLATVGCHSDDFLRDGGHDNPVTILRAANVERYIALGRKSKPRHLEAVDA